jgi:hypothetical protein
MRFACLGYVDEQKWNAMTESEREAIVRECFAYDAELLKKGHWLHSGQALQSAGTAKTLRWKRGKVLVTDGPFAETKEQLGGIGLLEARDMKHVVELMSKHPGARLGLGPFEIRPIDEALTERCGVVPAVPNAAEKGATVVCLAYESTLSKDELDALIQECKAYDEVLRKHGRWVDGAALQSASTAKTVRSGRGKVLITDGPYAETKEQVGGFATFVFQDIDRAIEAWKQHPCLRIGDTLELRVAVRVKLSRRSTSHQREVARARYGGISATIRTRSGRFQSMQPKRRDTEVRRRP